LGEKNTKLTLFTIYYIIYYTFNWDIFTKPDLDIQIFSPTLKYKLLFVYNKQAYVHITI